MAISEDTAALVAAQLTQAWATVFAEMPGGEKLHGEHLTARIAKQYLQFRDAVAEVDFGKVPR